jgi:C1A family cysteine protease
MASSWMTISCHEDRGKGGNSMDELNESYGFGWLPDYPDYRDFTIETEDVPLRLKALGQVSVSAMLNKLGGAEPPKAGLPPSRDLRGDCSPIENQDGLGSCTAHAGIGLVEYFERKAFGRHIDASRLFLYKATRNLMQLKGDTGAYIRTTMAAMVLFGVPHEKYWPYVIADFDIEPPAFCYSFAQNYQAITYYRLDPPKTNKEDLLNRIRLLISYQLPSMFGFTVFSSISQAKDSGKIPYPYLGDTVLGGHAVAAVGYDDNMEIKHTHPKSKATTGALLIRNSWGTGWGERGYGWLPYDYVLHGLAIDWWTLAKSEWIDTDIFGAKD